MSRGRLGLLVAILSTLTAGLAAAGVPIQLSEPQTRVLVSPDGVTVQLAASNNRQSPVSVWLTLELLDPSDGVASRLEDGAVLRPGSSVLERRLALPAGRAPTELLWYRLRYRIIPEPAGDAPPLERVMALGTFMPQAFEVRVSAPAAIFPGARFRVQVRAESLALSRGARSVVIEGQLTLDDAEKPLKSTAITNRRGNAVLNFTLPDKIETEQATLRVTARRGGFIREAEKEIDVHRRPNFLISTDKPLYQPGQVVHVRALARSAFQRPLSGQEISLRIEDADDELVYRAELNSSRFGVVSHDWRIPDNLRLGDYTLRFLPADDEDLGGSHTIRISRYELPTFAVQVKADRGFYLPGENAEVEVRADYLFGKRVARGRVKVTRQEERRWDFHEQEWKVEEEIAAEGDTGPGGSFTARLELGALHQALADRSYQRFRDYTFAAYYTDSSTGRTEQRRFRLRITRQPIHLYLIEAGAGGSFEGVPADYYVSTSYPDGSPCRCEVAIHPRAGVHPGPRLRTVRTSRYGVAQVEDLLLPESKPHGLMLIARDSQGRSAHWAESVDLRQGVYVGVKTNQALYHPGEPVEISLTTSKPGITLVLDVATEKQVVVHSELVRMGRGEARLILPYRPEFRGILSVAAYSLTEGDSWSFPYGTRNIIYPHDPSLRVEARLDQPVYRPGSDAMAQLRVRAADGRPVEAVLGAVVFDQAVEERARADGEFSGRFGFDDGRWDPYATSIAGLTRRALERLDITEPFSAELDLAAEILLNASHSGYYPLVFGSSEYPDEAGSVYSGLVQQKLAPLSKALDAVWEREYRFPRDSADLLELLSAEGVRWDALRDPWGSPYTASFSVNYSWQEMELASAGPDKTPGNADDFLALRVLRSYFTGMGRALERAIAVQDIETGAQVRDLAALRVALSMVGVDLDGLRDPWGQPYQWRFGVSGNRYTVSAYTRGNPVASLGARQQEIHLWTGFGAYFASTQAEISAALAAHAQAGGVFPRDEADFLKLLAAAEIPSSRLRDGWDRPAYLVFSSRQQFAGRKVKDYAQHEAERVARVEPIMQDIGLIHVRSRGEDNIQGNEDDFDLALFSRVLAERDALQPAPNPAAFDKGRGAIAGVVLDATEAVIPNARVTATGIAGDTFTAATNSSGRYELSGLPAGQYRVEFESPGFQESVITSVPVRAGATTELGVTLQVAASSEMVEVASEPVSVNTVASHMATTVRGVPGSPPLLATPRVRQFFPETLVWQPELETDRRGRARLKFRMADSITSWKLSLVASTLEGEVGTLDTEVTAFQPFFLEHDPPPRAHRGGRDRAARGAAQLS